jgi:hypothetical protein
MEHDINEKINYPAWNQIPANYSRHSYFGVNNEGKERTYFPNTLFKKVTSLPLDIHSLQTQMYALLPLN